MNPIVLFGIRSSVALATKIADYFGQALGKVNFQLFSDGEYQPSFEESVRGKTVFIIGSTFPPADNIMEILLFCDAAKRASAGEVIAVVPYFGWARQDRKDKPRVPIAAKMVANMFSAAGISRIITIDLHADQIQGFFDIPMDHLYASSIFVPYIKRRKLDNLTIASPDMGGAKRATSYAKHLNAEIAICYKERKKANEIDYMNLIGNVFGRNVILIDDMVDTAGTLCKAAELIKEQGALSVSAMVTHGVLSGSAKEKVQQSKLKELVVTDTIPQKSLVESKIKVLSCASYFSEVMHLVLQKRSISEKFYL